MRSPPVLSDLSGQGSCCHARLLCPPFSRDTFTQVSEANLTHVVSAISLYVTRPLPFNPSLGEAVYTNEVAWVVLWTELCPSEVHIAKA